MTFRSSRSLSRYAHRSTFTANELTNDQIARLAPSVLAEGAHESRSDRYTYIPTITVIEALRGEGFGVFAATQSRSRIAGMEGHVKHMVTLRRYGDVDRVMKVGDHVNQINLTNSHNGTSKGILNQGVLELVCLNGLFVSGANYEIAKVPHKGDIVGGFLAAAHRLAASFDIVDEMRETMQTTVLSQAQSESFARQAIRARFEVADATQAPVTAAQVLNPRRYADQGMDAWRVLNRVQENVIQGGIHTSRTDANNRVRRGTTRTVNGIDQNVRVNRHVWESMEVMIAEIRGMAAPSTPATVIEAEYSEPQPVSLSASKLSTCQLQACVRQLKPLANPCSSPAAPTPYVSSCQPWVAVGAPRNAAGLCPPTSRQQHARS